jgi:hypothetical protein
MLRLRLACLSFLACTIACASDDFVESASSRADESGTASETTANNNETGDTKSSGDGDGDGEPTTGDGDGEPTTGDGDGDGDPTTGDGDGDGDADPTTGDGDGDGDADPTTGDGDGDGDGDGEPIPEYYGACPFNEDGECESEEYCLDQAFENWQVCTTSCGSANDCPPAPPNASVQCIAINGNIFNKGCFLSCEGNNQCPQGMSCESENANIDKICVFDI